MNLDIHLIVEQTEHFDGVYSVPVGDEMPRVFNDDAIIVTIGNFCQQSWSGCSREFVVGQL